MNVHWAQPWLLLLLVLLPPWLYRLRQTEASAVTFGRAEAAASRNTGRSGVVSALPTIARGLGFALLVVALAGPRGRATVVETETEGIAVVIAMDVSSSMLAEDFRPNRLEVAKRTVMSFIQEREEDRIGLVAFAGEALTQVPVTVDYAILFSAIQAMGVGQLEDGTAIGMGLATAANRLRSTPGESKIIILMSDGENNRGEVDPRDAAKAAAAHGIRVFTVGVGSRGTARVPVARSVTGRLIYRELPVSIDEPLLNDIARTTGGRYFRATDATALRRIYGEIDQLVKSSVRVRRYTRDRELYLPFLLAGTLLLLVEWLVRGSRWGVVP